MQKIHRTQNRPLSWSPVLCYSVESYAYNMRNDSSVPYLAELVERMMCYGDSARAYVESIS